MMSYTSFPVPILVILCACSEQKERFVDNDNDGWTIEEGDCDDNNEEISPEANEICDHIDNNCDGSIDDDSRFSHIWYQDADADGFGSAQSIIYSCTQPEGFVENQEDCDDDNALIHTQASETLRDIGIDNNCDGFSYTEEHPLVKSMDIPSYEQLVFVPNFQFRGPSFFFLSTETTVFTFTNEDVYTDLLPTTFSDAFPVRNTELWYIEEPIGHINQTLHQLGTERSVLFEHNIINVVEMESFFGYPMPKTGIVIENNGFERLYMSSHSVLNEEQSDLEILLSEQDIVDVHNAPDINGDGYDELWITHEHHGSLHYGGETFVPDMAWTIFYDEPCQKIDFATWEDNETIHAFCLQDSLSIWDIGSPYSTAQSEDMPLLETREESIQNFVMTDQFLLAQHENQNILSIYSPLAVNPTHISYSDSFSDASFIALERTNTHTEYSLFIVQPTEYKIVFETLGLFSP